MRKDVKGLQNRDDMRTEGEGESQHRIPTVLRIGAVGREMKAR